MIQVNTKNVKYMHVLTQVGTCMPLILPTLLIESSLLAGSIDTAGSINPWVSYVGCVPWVPLVL